MSFGGPVAHLGYFSNDFVTRRKWLTARGYADVVALCQFLPGPSSSQVGIVLGMSRAGVPGALAAWLGFTMPSAILLIAFAYGVTAMSGIATAPWLHGLKIVAVAVVAQAVYGMGKVLCPDRPRIALAVLAAILVLMVQNTWGQLGAIAGGGVCGLWLLRADADSDVHPLPLSVPKPLAVGALVLFFALLAGLPALATSLDSQVIRLIDSFYRAGSLVFGGGHVVLPLLQKEVVPPGWISNEDFLAGYGAAQAVPGPLFSFAAYLGAILKPSPNGIAGAAICLVAIYLPSFLLLLGALPFWEQLRRLSAAQSALKGINAAVVGLLLAALYTPIWTSAMTGRKDFALALGLFALLVFWRVPSWVVVVLGMVCAVAVG
jgi:chromate transporter